MDARIDSRKCETLLRCLNRKPVYLSRWSYGNENENAVDTFKVACCVDWKFYASGGSTASAS